MRELEKTQNLWGVGSVSSSTEGKQERAKEEAIASLSAIMNDLMEDF